MDLPCVPLRFADKAQEIAVEGGNPLESLGDEWPDEVVITRRMADAIMDALEHSPVVHRRRRKQVKRKAAAQAR